MIVAVLASDKMKQELLLRKTSDDIEMVWCDSVKTLAMVEAQAYFDLQYRNDTERNDSLTKKIQQPIFVGDVNNTSSKKYNFIRLNNWPGFLKHGIIELAISTPNQNDQVKEVMDKLGWSFRLVPDKPGFISARVIASIINEAYFALGEHVSTREDIDTAMKLGTNYPYGPFEWCGLIGIENIYSLLKEMEKENERYAPAPALKEEFEVFGKS